VSHPFSIARSRFSVLSDPALLEEIRRHTETDGEASSILRSLERFGTDGSIRYFEMTPKHSRRNYGQHPVVAWSVTAVR
jgi:hypothetical protein